MSCTIIAQLTSPAAMFAFGCSIIMADVYQRCARPGIERAGESDSSVLAHAASGSVARSFNLLLDQARALDGLEGLVLLHQDAEILDTDFCSRLRDLLADPEVAIVGCVGSRGVSDIAWWDGDVTWNSAPYHHGETGGGELAWGKDREQAPGEVDAIYGVLMALSPWAVANVRFDESIGLLHGYDYDICRQARMRKRKVVTADLRVAHHHSLDLVSDVEIWVAAHMRAAELWEPGGPEPDEHWRPRARRAEASAAAARLLAASKLLQADATSRQYAAEADLILSSRSWRLTEPLRLGNALLRSARARVGRP